MVFGCCRKQPQSRPDLLAYLTENAREKEKEGQYLYNALSSDFQDIASLLYHTGAGIDIASRLCW